MIYKKLIIKNTSPVSLKNGLILLCLFSPLHYVSIKKLQNKINNVNININCN